MFLQKRYPLFRRRNRPGKGNLAKRRRFELEALEVRTLLTTLFVDSANLPGPGTGTQRDPFISIQAAINRARTDDNIQVAPGKYTENLVMKSGVDVIGAGANSTTIVGTASADGVVLFDDIADSELSAFTITVDRPEAGVDRAVVVRGRTDSSAVISHNVLLYTQYGLFVFAPAKPTIRNNTLVGDRDEQGIYIGNDPTAPIIKNNIIMGYDAGIHVVAGTDRPQPIIEFNDVVGNRENYRNYPDLTGRFGNISKDPMFVGREDFRLLPDSPVINQADPTSAKDPDGTRADMGAIPFQHEEPEPPEFARTSKAFSIDSRLDVPFKLFSVTSPGKLVIDVEWTDPDQVLTVELQGRRRFDLPDPTIPYASQTGTSGLQLTYDVTAEDLERGVAWRVVVKDPSRDANVQGAITVTAPFDQATDERFQLEKISLRSGEHWPSKSLNAQFFDRLSSAPDRLHGMISLTKACNCFETRRLENLGLVRQTYMPRRNAFGYVRRGLDPGVPDVRSALRFVTPLDPEDKINPHVLVGNWSHFSSPDDGLSAERGRDNYVVGKDGLLLLSVKFADDVPQRRAETLLNNFAKSASVIHDGTWQAVLEHENVVPLAEFDEVEWIGAPPHPGLADNDITRAIINANAAQGPVINAGAITYNGLTGNGVTVGVQDTGIDGAHNDLNVVATVASRPVDGHGTHVAGTIAASGTQSNQNNANGVNNGGVAFQFRGMAPNANLIGSGDLVTQGNLELAVGSGLDLINRSQSFSFDGAYQVDDQAIDKYLRGGADSDATLLRHPWIISAGNHQTFPNNQRPPGPPPGTPVGTSTTINGGQTGYFSITKQPKNSLIVGNWDAGNNRLSRSSSLGPAHDGRIKPDVVAPGTGITSTGTNGATSCTNANVSNGYGTCSGTSMATPAVSGVYAQLLEAWQNTYSQPLSTNIDANPPLPSTLRAVVVQTSRDIFDEDVNNNGVLDPGEDQDSDGVLDAFGPGITNADIDADGVPGTEDTNGNGILDAGEDLNGNGILENRISDGNGQPTTTVGPDYATGWGLVDAAAATTLLQDATTVQGRPVPNRIIQDSAFQNEIIEYDFVVDQDFVAAGGPVRVTLAWDDIEASTQALATNPTLVNDLDLELIDPDGNVFYPWQLGHTILDGAGNPLADDAQPPGTNIQVQVPITPISNPSYTYVANAAGNWGRGTNVTTDFVPQAAVTPNPVGNNDVWVARKGKDHLNNLEVVELQPTVDQVGHWTARVIGFDIQTSDAQDFSVVGFPYPDVPDLVVATPERVALPDIGEFTEFTWEAQNIGPEATSESFEYEIFLSRDFALGPDDVVLTDTNQAPIGPLSAGGAATDTASVTSQIQITQANADDLMGTTSGTTTINDLIADDVFLLVRVDSGDDILEHNETNLGVLQLARQADVVLVYDRSGSMGATIPVSNGSRMKVEVLQDSAELFLDLMRLDAGDQLAEVSFADSTSIDFGPTDALTEIGADNVEDAKEVVDKLLVNGGTNIREALEKAIDLFHSTVDDARRRVIIFFSDGMKTVGGKPDDPLLLQRLVDRNIQVFSVGFGTRGGAGISGLDTELLQTLATSGEPGFFEVTENPLDLDKFFVNAVAGAIDSEVIVDPVRFIENGDMHTLPLQVNEQDRIATFILSWDDPKSDLELSLVSPAGQVIKESNIDKFADRVTRNTSSSYKLMEIQLPLKSGAQQDHAGQWLMRVENRMQKVEYSASAIAQSTVRFSVMPPDPQAEGNFKPGDSIDFQAVLHQNSQAPIENASVMVTPSVPAVGLGDFLAAYPISDAQLALIPEQVNGEVLSLQERMYQAAKMQLGGDPLQSVPGTPFELRPGNESNSFVGAFRNTQTDGVYEFLIGATGQTESCHVVQREVIQSATIAPQIDPDSTEIDVTTPVGGDDDGLVIIDITPTLVGGGLLGPGWASLISIDGEGITPVGDTEDNGDGTYSQTIRLADIAISKISATIAELLTGNIVVQTSVPAPQSITPSGASNDTAQQVTITTVDDATQVQGVVLVGVSSLDVEVSLTNVTSFGNQVQGVVPAGIPAGYYEVYLTGSDGRGPAGAILYQAAGASETSPDLTGIDNTLGALDGASTDAEALVELGTLLKQLRSLPTGPNFTGELKSDMVSQVAALMAQRPGRPDTIQLDRFERALNSARVDTEFIPTQPVRTPVGRNVQVDLGNGVQVNFGTLRRAGQTTMRLLPGPESFAGEVRGATHVAYDISTSGVFDPAGEIEVMIAYDETHFRDENELRVWHQEDGRWVDRTAVLDTKSNTITARVSTLSPFVIAQARQGESVLHDFGDAPRPYPTVGSAGASHQLVQGIHLGRTIDADKDGQPSATAIGDDDLGRINDEDGIQFLSTLRRGQQAKIEITAAAPGLLDAWIDFDANGRWDRDEQIFVSQSVNVGSQVLVIDVPDAAVSTPSQDTFARFRFSTEGRLQPGGHARDGEVEDYRVTVEAAAPAPLTRIDQLCRGMETRDVRFDQNGDRRVDFGDLEFLVQKVLATEFGDANLDGVFNSSDLVQVFQRGEYEDQLRANSTWDDGDWNCDNEFNTSDLVVAFRFGGFNPLAVVGIDRGAEVAMGVDPRPTAKVMSPENGSIGGLAIDMVIGSRHHEDLSRRGSSHKQDQDVLRAVFTERPAARFQNERRAVVDRLFDTWEADLFEERTAVDARDQFLDDLGMGSSTLRVEWTDSAWVARRSESSGLTRRG